MKRFLTAMLFFMSAVSVFSQQVPPASGWLAPVNKRYGCKFGFVNDTLFTYQIIANKGNVSGHTDTIYVKGLDGTGSTLMISGTDGIYKGISVQSVIGGTGITVTGTAENPVINFDGSACSQTTTALAYAVADSVTNTPTSYTNASLIGKQILLPVGVNGNVFMNTDWTFDISTGTITYTSGLSEGDIINLSYTDSCGGGGTSSCCEPVLWSHGEWDLGENAGSFVHFGAGEQPLGALAYVIPQSKMPNVGDYAMVNVRVTNTNAAGYFGFQFGGGATHIWALDSVQPGIYNIELKIKRTTEENSNGIRVYCSIDGPNGSKTVDFSGINQEEYFPNSMAIIPWVWVSANDLPANDTYIEANDYDITVFNK